MTAPLIPPWPPIRQALIRQLRSNLVLAEGLLGDWSSGQAPQGTKYPRGVISLHYAPSLYDWTGRVVPVGVDVLIWADDEAQASSLYQLAFTTLQDARLTMAGQTSLSCRATSDISLPDVNEEGKSVYSVGGVFEIKVAQSNPALGTFVFTLDATIAPVL